MSNFKNWLKNREVLVGIYLFGNLTTLAAVIFHFSILETSILFVLPSAITTVLAGLTSKIFQLQEELVKAKNEFSSNSRECDRILSNYREYMETVTNLIDKGWKLKKFNPYYEYETILQAADEDKERNFPQAKERQALLEKCKQLNVPHLPMEKLVEQEKVIPKDDEGYKWQDKKLQESITNDYY